MLLLSSRNFPFLLHCFRLSRLEAARILAWLYLSISSLLFRFHIEKKLEKYTEFFLFLLHCFLRPRRRVFENMRL